MAKNDLLDAPSLIEQLIAYSLDKLSLKIEDIHFVRNQLLKIFNILEPAEAVEEYGRLQEDLLDTLIEYAVKNKIIKAEESLLFETRIMGIVTPLPSQVISEFDMLASNEGIESATDYLYDLSINNNYIRLYDINKNIEWAHSGSLGDLKITINLAKPEKDLKEVLKEAKSSQSYPKCKLCVSNVGFYGSLDYPPRQTLRTIPIFLQDEYWHLQYSPYCYFKEHLIALSDEHRPMLVDVKAIERMLDFVEIFPHYFIGSNAALPIVGGSILSHDHYQGGAKVMPMMQAPTIQDYYSPRYTSVKLSTLNWYNSVIRLSSTRRDELVKAVSGVMEYWENYTNESIGIIAKTDNQHNAVTPIVRLEDRLYIVDLILRNNRTDDKHPYGIFHPTEDLHNIKKESIGLIEAMGLFILPGRLYHESKEIQKFLTGEIKLDFEELSKETHYLNKHLSMIAQLTNDYGTQMDETVAGDVITEYINNAVEKIISITALFKNNEEGQDAFMNLIDSMGFYPE